MFAVFETGGKQYRARPGDVLDVEKLAGSVGDTIEFGRVLMVGEGEQVEIGTPIIDGGLLRATVVEQGRGEKIRIFKMKRRKGYRKTQGHRQHFTRVRIDEVVGSKKGAEDGT